jgi:hypothetical protein
MDEVTNTPLDMDHPRTQLFDPGPLGLCSDWFLSTTSSSDCFPDEYAKNINFSTKTSSFRNILSNCALPATLKWDDAVGDFVCSSEYLDYITNTVLDPQLTVGKSTIEGTAVNSGDSEISYSSYRYNLLVDHKNNVYGGLGPTIQQKTDYAWSFVDTIYNHLGESDNVDVIGSSDSAFTGSSIKCPDGWFVWAYESRQSTEGNNCRVRCKTFYPIGYSPP